MIITALLLSALFQDQVDSPEYKGWASFKPGSTVTFKYIREGSDQPGEQKIVLKSIDEQEAVLETEITINGKVAGGRSMERKVPAKIPAAQAGQKMKEGEEEIEVAGKKLKCKTREFEKKLPSGKTGSLRFWISDEIPGMVAKVETTTEGSPKITMTATGWEKK